MRVFTVGHGARALGELLDVLRAAGVRTIVDVRRFPGSRRHPHFGRVPLEQSLGEAGIRYLHLEALGGRRSGEAGEERFACLRVPAFRSYAARMARSEFQDALAEALEQPAPCLMCAETPWWRCHRRLLAELLAARGHEVLHLIRPHEVQAHRFYEESEVRDGRLYVCGNLVA